MLIPRPPPRAGADGPAAPNARREPGAKTLLLAAVALSLLAACGPSRLPAPPRRQALNAVPPDQTHAAAILADVENARFALSRRHGVAADNDLLRAIDGARRLPDEMQDIFVAAPAGAGRVGPFAVRVQLIQAQTALAAGDPEGADRILSAILARTPASVVPPRLPLVRAKESLTLAADAAKSGEKEQLAAQLEDAEAALDRYAAPSKADRALADEIRPYVRDPGRLAGLSVEQPALWAGKIGE